MKLKSSVLVSSCLLFSVLCDESELFGAGWQPFAIKLKPFVIVSAICDETEVVGARFRNVRFIAYGWKRAPKTSVALQTNENEHRRLQFHEERVKTSTEADSFADHGRKRASKTSVSPQTAGHMHRRLQFHRDRLKRAPKLIV